MGMEKERLKILSLNELADVVAREHGNVHRSGELGAAALMRLFERCAAALCRRVAGL